MRSRILFLLVLLSAAARADTYDFAYAISGDPRVTPIQVFDDGKRTWLQFVSPGPPPVILAVTPAGQAVLNPKPEGQFVVIDRVERQLAIVLGPARATVRYKGTRAEAPAMFGASAPAKATGKAPAPVPAEQLLAARKTRPLPSASAQSVASDVPISVPTVEPALASSQPVEGAQDAKATAKPLPTWSVQAGDMLRKTLTEWSARAGWSFVWGLPDREDVRLGAANTYEGEFPAAVRALIDSLPHTIRIRPRTVPDNNPPLLYVGTEEGR